MKTFCLLCVLLLPYPMWAQSAPDRAGDVERFMNANVHRFNGTDARRREVLFDLIRHLNVEDNGNWGALQKTDQGNKIPADIIVWRPTREHFDIFTDIGAIWRVVGVLSNPHWIWLQVEGPTPAPPAPPAPAVNLEPLFNAIAALNAKLKQLESKLSEIDHKLLTETETREWRLNELGMSFMQHKAQDSHPTICEANLNFMAFRIPISCQVK